MLILSLLATAATVTPSFDCGRATTEVERTICADADLALRDRAMAIVYAKRPTSSAWLMRTQQRWLAERNRCGTRDCLLLAYDRGLSQLASSISFAESYRHESYSGSLSVMPVAAGWHLFSIGKAGYAATGESVMADAAGLIYMQDGVGLWQVKAGCSLQIARSGTRWLVTHDHTCAKTFSGLSLSGLYLTEAEWWTAPDIEAAQPPSRSRR